MVTEGKSTFSTCGEGVIARNERTEISLLAPCTYEEADTRLMVHVLDAASRGHRRIRIRSSNKDVVVLAISVAGTLPTDELWVTYGPGKNVQNIPAHAIAMSLGPDKASTPPMFHALTGCDTVSFFGGRGKKPAWDVWKVPQLTPVLKVLKASPQEITEECMAVKVNQPRPKFFSKRAKSLDSIPPTIASLEQHVKRAVFQGGYVWG